MRIPRRSADFRTAGAQSEACTEPRSRILSRCHVCCRRLRVRSPGPESPDLELRGAWWRGLRLGVCVPLSAFVGALHDPPSSFSFPLSLDKAPLCTFRKNAQPLPVLSAPGSQLVREGRGGAQWARTTQPARPSVRPAGLPGRRAHAQVAGGTACPGSSRLLRVSSFPAGNCKRSVLLLCRPIHLHHVNSTSHDFGQCLCCHTAPFRSLIYLDGTRKDSLPQPHSCFPAVTPVQTPIQRHKSVWRDFILPREAMT